MSFNGTRSAATRAATPEDLDLSTTPVQTAELWLEDKCESENFLFLDGQEVHIQGSIVGTLEIAINQDICTACNAEGTVPDVCSVNALSFLDPSDPTEAATVYDYSTLCSAGMFAASSPIRFFVYATKGSHSLCDGTCHDQEPIVCPYTLGTQEVVAANGMPKTLVVGGNSEDNTITSFDVGGGNIVEKVIATVGATVIDADS